jgi:hypothetical protein
MSPSDAVEVVKGRKTKRREDGVAIVGTVQDRAYQAYMMHMAGKPWEEVAAEHGYASVMSAQVEVRQYVTRAAVQMDNAKREEVLGLEMARLDALQNAVWDDAMDGNTKAVDTVLRVMSHRAKLLGLELIVQDAGKVTNNTIVVTGSQEEFIRSLTLVRGEADA